MTTPSLEITGPLARITLRRPETANKLAPEDLPALRAHLCDLNAAEDVRVLILQSAVNLRTRLDARNRLGFM